jgi:hypothetical protein
MTLIIAAFVGPSILAGCASTSPSAPTASAQDPETVKDVLSRGGKRLSKNEVVALYSGATVSGQQVDRPATTFENRYKTDGTLSGVGRTDNNPWFGITGKWSVDDTGLLCHDLSNRDGSTSRLCSAFFALDDSYFAARADDPAARVWRRTIKR